MFFKGLWGYLPANILQGIIGFATLMVFTRVLTPEAYGQYALAFGLSSLVYTLVFTWMEAAMARFYIAESRDVGIEVLGPDVNESDAAMMVWPCLANQICIVPSAPYVSHNS